jgi:hypothetical protein
MIRLHMSGSQTESPGNFSFLQVNGSAGASAIKDMFAGASNPTCYDAGTVVTAPGAKTSVGAAINTRFDMYMGNYSNNSGYIPSPAVNVRKGALPDIRPNGSVNDCVSTGANSAVMGDDHVFDIGNATFNNNGTDDYAYGLPDNLTMSLPNQGLPGGAIGTTADWDITTYFEKNYGPLSSTPSSTDPHPDNVVSSVTGLMPSRYDVYLAELANGWYNLPRAPGDPANPGLGESGSSRCGSSMNPQRTPDTSPTALDRRLIVGAMIDCKSQSGEGGGINTYVVNSYVSMFLTRPVYSYSPSVDPTIDIEIVDVTGSGSNGTLETFIRNEAILVR